jgi:hypothetical protein
MEGVVRTIELQLIEGGELVMEELRKLDQVAYIRFASVYREFSDVSQFVETLKALVGSSEAMLDQYGLRQAPKGRKKKQVQEELMFPTSNPLDEE